MATSGAGETTPILKKTENESPLYHDATQTNSYKAAQLVFFAGIVISSCVTFALSVYKTVTYSRLYVLPWAPVFGLLILNGILIIMSRRGDLNTEKSWLVYAFGVIVLAESIIVDILMFL